MSPPSNRDRIQSTLSIVMITALVFLSPSTAPAKVPAELAASIDKVVLAHVKKDGPGVAVLVVHQGKVVHRKGYGLADVENETPISPSTAFDLASVSKQFTAMAIMLLAERGKLKYTDDVASVLPDYEAPAKGRPVRVQELLWHTSGLADYTGDEWQGTDEEFRDLTTAAHLAWLNGTKARRAPGVKYEYNNGGYALLAQIVQHVSGESYSQFLKREIFEPLEMRGTVVFDSLDIKVPGVAMGYRVEKNGKVRRSHSPSVICGDGNIFSTVDDLTRWDAALRKHKVVKEATLARAFTPGKLDSGESVGYGFGWLVERDVEQKLWVGHGGSWAGTATYISRYVDDEVTVILLSNNEHAPVEKIGESIAELVNE